MSADVIASGSFLWLTNFRPTAAGESVLGYIWSASHMSGYIRQKDLISELIGRQAIQPPWTVPSGLTRIYEAFRPVFASPEEIIAKHTCLPAHLPFIEPATRLTVLSHVLQDRFMPGVASHIGIAGRAIRSKPVMALCLDCVRRDEAKLGFPYWHREHSLAGLGYCPTHETPLVAGCGSCRFSHRLGRAARIPRTRCWCGARHTLSHPELSRADGKVVARLTRYAQRLLEGELDGATPEMFGAYYFMRLRQMGYSAGRYLKTPRIIEDVRNSYSSEVLWRLNSDMNGGQNWLSSLLGRRSCTNVIGRNLLLFDFLGSGIPKMDDLKAALDAYGDFVRDETNLASRAALASKQTAAQRDKDREAVLTLLKCHPGATRTQALRRLGRTVERLRTHDLDWLNKVLPASRRNNTTKSREDADEGWRTMDLDMAAHVYAKRDELLSAKNGFGKKLTKRVLLQGFRRGNEVTKEWLEKMPLSRQALYECIESSLEHKMVIAEAVIRKRLGRKDVISHTKSVTGLPVSTLRDIVSKVQFELLCADAGLPVHTPPLKQEME